MSKELEKKRDSQHTQQMLIGAIGIFQNEQIKNGLSDISKVAKETNKLQRDILNINIETYEESKRQSALLEKMNAEKEIEKLEEIRLKQIKHLVFEVNEELKSLSTEEDFFEKYLKLISLKNEIDRNNISAKIVDDFADKEYISESLNTLNKMIKSTEETNDNYQIKILRIIELNSIIHTHINSITSVNTNDIDFEFVKDLELLKTYENKKPKLDEFSQSFKKYLEDEKIVDSKIRSLFTIIILFLLIVIVYNFFTGGITEAMIFLVLLIFTSYSASKLMITKIDYKKVNIILKTIERKLHDKFLNMLRNKTIVPLIEEYNQLLVSTDIKKLNKIEIR